MQDRYSNLQSVNSGLTATGWEQVEKLAIWLRTHEAIDALYSGPLLQSRLTAQRIGQATGLPVTVIRDLPLLPAQTAHATRESLDKARLISNAGNRPPRPGNGHNEQERHLVSAIDKMLLDHLNGTVALVTSAENIRSVVRYLTCAANMALEIDHTSISELRFENNAWSIGYINRREHLPAPAIEPADDKELSTDVSQHEDDLRAVIAVYNRVATEDVAQKANDDRDRIRDFLKFADLPPGLEILDIGTGLGVLALMMAEEGAKAVIGIDISPGMLEQAEYLRLSHPSETTGRVSFRLARAQSLPFRDERFDAVTCRLVLNHSQSPQRIMREVVRVLKPGGLFVMAELLSVDDPVKRATQNAIEERRNPSHVAARSAEQYNKLITDAGLEIVNTKSASVERELREWLAAYRTSPADAAKVIEMVEAGLETDAAGINARKRGDRIEFVQRMYYLKAVKPAG